MPGEVIVAEDRSVARMNLGEMLAGVLAAARDQSVDPAKLSALIDLAERMHDRSAKEQFFRALNAAQREMPRITKRGAVRTKTGAIQSRYAVLEDIDEAIRPVYQSHGFAVTFPGAQVAHGGKYVFSARVMHSAGHVEEYAMPLEIDTSGAKNATQGAGSTMSYARRYLLKSIFNVIEDGEDDDGAGAKRLTDDQVIHLRNLCLETAGNEARFAAVYGVSSIEEIPAAMYRAAVSVLEQRRAKR